MIAIRMPRDRFVQIADRVAWYDCVERTFRRAYPDETIIVSHNPSALTLETVGIDADEALALIRDAWVRFGM